jgi:pimeloyl-ACP methyl ester carboxylesterase
LGNAAHLEPALPDTEIAELNRRAGRLSCYVAGEGSPLLLIHSINAAGSAYEIRPIFEHFRSTHRCFAPDLPGFGKSDRSRREYSVALYRDAILDVLDFIAEQDAGQPVDALALSLSSEFLARAATETADRFRSLTLVTPTGFRAGSEKLRAPPGTTRNMPWLSAILEFPLWRKGLYGLLTRPATIRYFLKRTWGSDDWDPGLAAYDDLTTDVAGAENAPYAFLSGKLFSRDIRNVYETLKLPVWLPHGTRGDFGDFSGADWARARDNWQVEAFDSGALPHFELPERFMRSYRHFLEAARTSGG